MNTYKTIVGVEIHVELKTVSKMFCGCKNDPFGAEKPNIYTCPVCLGMPGGLPVPNKKALDWTMMLGLALNCKIAEVSKFDRKNYFYPDIPKGYQISQYDQPLCHDGWLEVQGKKVGIRRVHLEEDTGKLQHATVDGQKVSLVDFNRSGVPLVEIVTEPDIHSGEEARVFLKKLHQIVQYLGISDADMEKGSMRIEPNISVQRPDETELPDYKVEVKNINSFSFVKKAIEFEAKRHAEIRDKGILPPQETRGWNENKNMTFSQRRKEDADDYRYFPEPDIPPMRFERTVIKQFMDQLPELPETKKNRFIKSYELSDYDAELLIDTQDKADYFERCVKLGKSNPKQIANWLINKKIDIAQVTPEELIKQITTATTVTAVSEDELIKIITQVIADNPKAVADYKAGKVGVIMFLLGMCIKALKGAGDKQVILEKLKEQLSS